MPGVVTNEWVFSGSAEQQACMCCVRLLTTQERLRDKMERDHMTWLNVFERTGSAQLREGFVTTTTTIQQVNVIDKGPHPSTKHHFKSVSQVSLKCHPRVIKCFPSDIQVSSTCHPSVIHVSSKCHPSVTDTDTHTHTRTKQEYLLNLSIVPPRYMLH